MTTLSEYLHNHDLLGRIDTGVDKLGLQHETANDIFDEFHKWVVRINHRAKARAGLASYRKKQIELTCKFFEAVGREADHNQTLLHEVAHVIVRYAYGRNAKGHGKEWKRVMTALDLKPNRCSSYSYMKEGRKKAAKHKYECKDCGVVSHTIRKLKNIHNRYHGPCRHKPNGGRLKHTQLR